MLDKRRIYANGLPSCTIIFLLSLFLMSCFSIWLYINEAKQTISTYNNLLVPGYVLLLPENVTSFSYLNFLDKLPPNDVSTLIDLRNFKFIINHSPCNKTQPFLLILVHSAPWNFEKRQVVRETWGQQAPDTVLLFFIGISKEYHNELIEEDKRFNDLIQGNFIDVYRNMTYKHVMALKWTTYFCSSAKYILKLDDDVFVHIPAMLEFLKNGLSPWGVRRLILCNLLPTTIVKRSWRSKWRVSPKEYPEKHYPTYCAGWAIIYSPDSAFLLYQQAQKEPYFWIDDVHITGTLVRKLNLTHTSLHSLVLSSETMQSVLTNTGNSPNFLFGPPNLSENNIRALYNFVLLTRVTTESKVHF